MKIPLQAEAGKLPWDLFASKRKFKMNKLKKVRKNRKRIEKKLNKGVVPSVVRGVNRPRSVDSGRKSFGCYPPPGVIKQPWRMGLPPLTRTWV